MSVGPPKIPDENRQDVCEKRYLVALGTFRREAMVKSFINCRPRHAHTVPHLHLKLQEYYGSLRWQHQCDDTIHAT